MVKSRRQTTKELVCNELEAAGRQVSVSAVRCVWHQHELLYKKEVLDPDGAPYSSTEVCCWSHGQRKKPSGRKLCGHMKQKLTCFVTMSSNMSGEEKVRPSTQEHRYPILKTAMWGEGIFNQILELLYVYLWSSRFGHIFRRCILNKLLNQTAWMFLWQSSLHVLLILS